MQYDNWNHEYSVTCMTKHHKIINQKKEIKNNCLLQGFLCATR